MSTPLGTPGFGHLLAATEDADRGFGFVLSTVTTSGTCPGYSPAPPPCRLVGFARLLASLDVVTMPTYNLATVSTVDGSGYWVGPTPVGLCRADP